MLKSTPLSPDSPAEGWAREAPSETFLQDVVSRWRQQSFGSSAIEPEPAPAPAMPDPLQRPTAPLRQPAAAAFTPSGATPPPITPNELQGIQSRLRRTLPPLTPGETPTAPPPQQPADAGAKQTSISSLLKQFRA